MDIGIGIVIGIVVGAIIGFIITNFIVSRNRKSAVEESNKKVGTWSFKRHA